MFVWKSVKIFPLPSSDAVFFSFSYTYSELRNKDGDVNLNNAKLSRVKEPILISKNFFKSFANLKRLKESWNGVRKFVSFVRELMRFLGEEIKKGRGTLGTRKWQKNRSLIECMLLIFFIECKECSRFVFFSLSLSLLSTSGQLPCLKKKKKKNSSHAFFSFTTLFL